MSEERGRAPGLSRREALRLLAAAGVSALLPRGAGLRGAPQRPNVLFITVDDLNTRIGCFGHPEVHTPNLDRLAERGVRFERCYCQVPLCNPSRSSVLTGRRPATTGVVDNKPHFRVALPDVITLPQHFRAHGYWTARVGKVYHGGLGEEAGWDVAIDRVPVPRELRQGLRLAGEGGNLDLLSRWPGTGGQQGRGRRPAGRGSSLAWRSIDGPDEALTDGQSTVKALELLRERPGERPFFLAVGYYKPHLTWVAPKRYFDLYALEAIKLPQMPQRYRERAQALRPGRVWNAGVGDEEVPQLILAYQACTSFIDAQVGRLLEGVAQAGVADETVVILWGDNGFQLGEHGRWGKVDLYEPSARVPLICVAPGRGMGGEACRRLVEFVDIYPSLAEACGLPAPEGAEGVSFAGLLDRPDRPWKKAAFTENKRERSVRTERWRYIEARDGSLSELYDHDNDPGEYENLAGSPTHEAVVTEMRRLLEAGWRSALP